MRKALYILSEFTDQDIDWITDSGQKETIRAGEVLIAQGKQIEAVWFILRGRFSVTSNPGGNIAEVGAGEVVGELSFLDSRPPNASVTATENSIVLRILRSRLQNKLKADLGFGARFYRALGILLADRIRATITHLAYGSTRSLSDDVESDGEISEELMEGMSLAAARFEMILDKMLK